jgi:hypothetical protein
MLFNLSKVLLRCKISMCFMCYICFAKLNSSKARYAGFYILQCSQIPVFPILLTTVICRSRLGACSDVDCARIIALCISIGKQ